MQRLGFKNLTASHHGLKSRKKISLYNPLQSNPQRVTTVITALSYPTKSPISKKMQNVHLQIVINFDIDES